MPLEDIQGITERYAAEEARECSGVIGGGAGEIGWSHWENHFSEDLKEKKVGVSDSGIYGRNVPGGGKNKCEVLRGAVLCQYVELLGLHCSGTGVGKAAVCIGHQVRELQESDHVG